MLVKLGLVICFSIFLKWCVSLNKYSGAGKTPMFGDYEAQRHWMEITFNLPVQEWYRNSSRNDLMYWGLDYPPLTAYHSWLCGYVADQINPDWVQLNKSRGYESYHHQLFMRYSVLLADLLIFVPVACLYFLSLKREVNEKLMAILLLLLYPGLILIDYGHFQYNCISLGLTLAAIYFLSKNQDILGSAAFCLALNYKQMELYHAMPFFCYLLGSCFKCSLTTGLFRLTKIGLTVLSTFALCWLPFLSDKDSTLLVLQRLFPFGRGLYEDKVANVWCTLSVVVKLKQLLSTDGLIRLCFASTLVGLLPSSLDLLLRPSMEKFKLSLINSSLVFFLLSFQVHEKSILIPALAVCVIFLEQPFWSLWFLVISVFSMLPLLIKDGLVLPYIASTVLYTIIAFRGVPIFQKVTELSGKGTFLKLLFWCSMLGAMILTGITLTLPPPKHLPDLWSVAVSTYSCTHFIFFAVYFHIAQLSHKGSSTIGISRLGQSEKKRQ